MSIFSKKDKSTNKKKDLSKNSKTGRSDTSDSKKEDPFKIEVKEKIKSIQPKEAVDEIYPWLNQNKIDKPGADDFPNSKYVDEPKWKHHISTINTKETSINTDQLNVKSSPIKTAPPRESKINLSWEEKNKIEEPGADDFPNSKYVDEPKWKHLKTEMLKTNIESAPIAKATVEGITVKQTQKPIIEEKIEQKDKIQNADIDSLVKLKELASKKDSKPIEERNSGQKLGEMLSKEINKPLIEKPIAQTQNKIKIENTKFDWLKNEVIEKPKAEDFSGEEFVDEPKWKHHKQTSDVSTKTQPETTLPINDYSWMKKEKIEEPLETDFATQTKDATTHPKWIHDDSEEGDPSKANTFPILKTFEETDEPRWKKDIVSIKKKKSSLKTPIDEIFELLESYKQVDTGELAKYTKIDVYTIEKIMRTFEDYGIVEVRYPTSLGKKPTIKLKKEVKSRLIHAPKGKSLDEYELTVDFVPAKVSIILVADEARPVYNIDMPTIGKYTRTFLNYIKNEIAETLPIELDEITDPSKAKKLKDKFFDESRKQLTKYFPGSSTEMLDQLSGVVLHEMYGLGDLEVVMGDDMLEEVAINSAKTPVTVYHRIHGWLKTNLLPGTEEEIMNYSSQIGRKIGREITVLSPILDAHLLSGDRVNATLFPISAEGNTLTIRRFARRPWTLVDFIGKAHTMNSDMAALLWLAMQYEMNVVISGGTASGKTSALNTLLSLVPSYHRLISIEDVREIVLPTYLKWNWIPMVTRSPNPEGLGEVTMLDCMVTSLRMRPDRIIVGEIRRKKEAEVLMEAIETGHSIYSTVHANSAYQVLRRLAEPPMSIPPMQIELIDLIVVQYRDRKTNRRRTYEISEIEQTSTGKGLQVNTIYKWSPRTDDWEQLNKPTKLLTLLNMHTGLTEDDIEKELSTRKLILDWMGAQNISELNQIGFIMKLYYSNSKKVIDLATQKATNEDIGKLMK